MCKEWSGIINSIQVVFSDRSKFNLDTNDNFEKVCEIIDFLSTRNGGCSFERFVEQYSQERKQKTPTYEKVKNQINPYLPELESVDSSEELINLYNKSILRKSITEYPLLEKEFGEELTYNLCKIGCYSSVRSVYASLPVKDTELREKVVTIGLERVKELLKEISDKNNLSAHKFISPYIILMNGGTDVEPDWQELTWSLTNPTNLEKKFTWFVNSYKDVVQKYSSNLSVSRKKKRKGSYEDLFNIVVSVDSNYGLPTEAYNQINKLRGYLEEEYKLWLDNSLSVDSEKAAAINEQVSSLEKENAELKITIATFNEERNSLFEEKEELKKTLDSYRKELNEKSAKEEDLQKLKEELSQVHAQLDFYQSTFGVLNPTADTLSAIKDAKVLISNFNGNLHLYAKRLGISIEDLLIGVLNLGAKNISASNIPSDIVEDVYNTPGYTNNETLEEFADALEEAEIEELIEADKKAELKEVVQKNEPEGYTDEIKNKVESLLDFLSIKKMFDKAETVQDENIKGVLDFLGNADISENAKDFVRDKFDVLVLNSTINTVEDFKKYTNLNVFYSNAPTILAYTFFAPSTIIKCLRAGKEPAYNEISVKYPYSSQVSTCDKFAKEFTGDSTGASLSNFYAFISMLSCKIFQWGQDKEACQVVMQMKKLPDESIHRLKDWYTAYFSPKNLEGTLEYLRSEDLYSVKEKSLELVIDYYNLENKYTAPIIFSTLLKKYDLGYSNAIDTIRGVAYKVCNLICKAERKKIES